MDPRLSRSSSDHDRSKHHSHSPNRGDPRLRAAQEQQQQQQHQQQQQQLQQQTPQPPPQWPHPLAQMPQTHYTIGDGLTTYQHLVPNAATAIYPPAGPSVPYAQYPGYAAATAYQAYPAYAAYYAPAPPPQHIEPQQHATPYQQPTQIPGSYAPQGAPTGSWAPARMSEQVPVQVQTPITAYMQQQQQQQQQQAASTTTVPSTPDITSTTKQEGVEQEMHQTQAEMRRQRDDFERRSALLGRELEQLKKQKRELKQQLQQQNGDGGTPSKDRETLSILKDNTKLQMEIQSKLKELANRVELLSGILGDRKSKSSSHRSSSTAKERERSKHHRSRERSSTERHSGHTRSSRDRERSSRDKSAEVESTTSSGSTQSEDANLVTSNSTTQHQLPDITATVQYNYVHYDPEVHWCRICDAFPRTAKDLLQHLHDDDHRQLMQAENIEIPWHKLPSQDKEFPFREGATKRRVPIKGLQFFVSAPAWYCRLCDTWIGDLHCASQHLKSIGHTQNYANFVDQNPKWEKEWLEDRKTALERCSNNIGNDKKANATADGSDKKTKTSISSMQLEKKKRKKSKKSKKNKSSGKKGKKRRNSKKMSDESSGSSTSTSTSSTSDDSSSDENGDGVDKSKSIRVAMRNQVKKSTGAVMDEQIMILENLVKEKKRLQQQQFEMHAEVQSRAVATSSDKLPTPNNNDDRLISQWMNVDQAGNKISADGTVEEKKDKYLLDSLKDRLKQKQDKEHRARLLEQQQQQMEEEQARRKERAAVDEKQRGEIEDRERREREAREGTGVHSSSREQVKFRQFRGGKATTTQRRRSNDASPTTPNSPKNSRSSHRSRSRSLSSERRRGRGRGERDRRYSHPKHAGYRPPRRSSRSHSRSNSPSRINSGTKPKIEVSKDKEDLEKEKKPAVVTPGVPPGVPQKKLPFIGRMPLFKNRKSSDDPLTKAIMTRTDYQQDLSGGVGGDTYEMPRQSRFQPGNLARAFIPQPDVVHYPKLTTQPVIQPPPPPPVLPDPPRISVPRPPPPPNIQPTPNTDIEHHAELNQQHQQVYEYTEAEFDGVHHQHHEMVDEPMPPLPPLPPPPPNLHHYGMERGNPGEDFDDLAMLGISSDDMAAQIF